MRIPGEIPEKKTTGEILNKTPSVISLQVEGIPEGSAGGISEINSAGFQTKLFEELQKNILPKTERISK